MTAAGAAALAALAEGWCPLGHGRLEDPCPVDGCLCRACGAWWRADDRQVEVTVRWPAGSAGFSWSVEQVLRLAYPAVSLAGALRGLRTLVERVDGGLSGDPGHWLRG